MPRPFFLPYSQNDVVEGVSRKFTLGSLRTKKGRGVTPSA
jgi:hypothetical protein